MTSKLELLLDNPVIAILRGVTPDEVLAVAEVLVDAGFKVIEVPLNSPSPLLNIEKLAQHFGTQVLVGCTLAQIAFGTRHSLRPVQPPTALSALRSGAGHPSAA